MTAGKDTRRPAIAVLHAPGDPPPGMDGLADQADVRMADDGAGLKAALPGADILMVTDFRTDALEQAIHTADSLKWIHATSAGVDKVLIPEVRDSAIPVTNARGIFDRGIADYVVGAVFMVAKDFAGNLASQRAHEWRHRETRRVDREHLLVVGTGSIGHEIGRLARAVGMTVSGMGSRRREGDAVFGTVQDNSAFHDLLAAADHVAIAAPLTAETRHLFDREAFRAMPDHGHLINVGRGEIVDTDALLAALEAGEIGHASLDVFEEEPLPADHPLWDRPEVMMSAHMAGDFIGWEQALTDQFIANFRRWQAGEALFNIVNKEKGYGPARG